MSRERGSARPFSHFIRSTSNRSRGFRRLKTHCRVCSPRQRCSHICATTKIDIAALFFSRSRYSRSPCLPRRPSSRYRRFFFFFFFWYRGPLKFKPTFCPLFPFFLSSLF